MSESETKGLKRLKSGALERRVSIARAGLVAGSRLMAKTAFSIFTDKAQRSERQRQHFEREAKYLVSELGKLKGSAVKVGQMLALYGEHFLPRALTDALHTLEDQTTAMEWSVVEAELKQQLGTSQYRRLRIDRHPLAAASLGQVHTAVDKENGQQWCLKIQYPGVAEAIDGDLDSVARLLRLSRIVSPGVDFDDWIEEVRNMLHREVDYREEANQTDLFRQRVSRDRRFVVPEVNQALSTGKLLVTSFESGVSVSTLATGELSQSARNALGRSFLELFMREVFEWGAMQTDPNFGNYRIRPAQRRGAYDKLVLLDFGAVQPFPDSFLNPFREMIRGAYKQDLEQVRQGALGLHFIRPEYPESAQWSFTRLCASVIEPMIATPSTAAAHLFNKEGQYRWLHSDLPSRVAKEAVAAVMDRNFKVPAKEFMFLNRKLIGVYTFISALGSEFNGTDIIERYV